MNSVLWAGTVVGAALGLLHAGYVYRLISTPGGAAAHARAGYYAVWTLALWLLFGTYVLVLWIISVVAYTIAKAFRWRM
jgi:hypothetical protein